ALPSGDVVRPRRSILRADELEALLRAPAARRFALWQREARARGWAPLLSVQRGHGSPMLVPRDSPLAVEALFEGARDRVVHLTVDDANDETWLEDENGQRYKTEFAVPFARPRCAWDGEQLAARAPKRHASVERASRDRPSPAG